MEGDDVDPTKGILMFWQGQPSRMESKIVMKRLSSHKPVFEPRT